MLRVKQIVSEKAVPFFAMDAESCDAPNESIQSELIGAIRYGHSRLYVVAII